MYYFEALEALYKSKVDYLIVGGLAVNLYGVPRVTQDIDLIISIKKPNILKMIAVLRKLGYLPRLPVNPKDLTDSEKVKDWIENRNLKAFSFYHTIRETTIRQSIFSWSIRSILKNRLKTKPL